MTVTLLCGAHAENISVLKDETLLEAIRRTMGAAVHAPCGGQGTCQKCTVFLRAESGEQAVLACRTPVWDGMVIRVPAEGELAVEMTCTEQIPCDPDAGQKGYGIACDIGTTTVVCHLVERSTGKCVATVGEGNAQRPYGGDVIARIKASMEGQREVLTVAIREQLNRMIGALCREGGIDAAEISYMVVAANTTMCHLLAGLQPDGLGVAPFTPVSRFGEEYDAREWSLPFDGTVYLAPAVSGYVGGDITADVLAARMGEADKPVLLVDVGTNGEMVLGCGNRMICCSTAAGPAFEGAQISCGMTAAPGAISRVDWLEGKPVCTVIGDGEAVGLCGSALIDGVAMMLELGILDETGRLLDPEEDEDEIPAEAMPYLMLIDGQPAFRLTERVYITQADIRKLQLGKGAIAAGIRVLMDAYGVRENEVCELLLAGGFGSVIRPESAARIGLIPEELLPVTRAIGNGAALGAQMALVSKGARESLTELRDKMEYLELSGMPAFNNAYMDAMLFPEVE